MASLRPRRRPDEGFTLVEVVVALVLMSIMMSAIAVLFVGGIRNSAGLQRRQAAVVVAQQALETVRGVSARAESSGCVKLLQGRTQAAVDAQWAAPPATVDLSGTAREYAPVGCTGAAVVPLQDSVLLNGLPYTVRTLVGSCRVVATAVPATPPASTTTCGSGATGTRLYRVVVAVSWTGSGCTSATCTYSASTLVDPSPDPVHNVRAAPAPVAVNDPVGVTPCFRVNQPGALNVVGNDTGSLGRTPVTVVSPPTRGTLSSTISSGVAIYRPGATAGTDTFTYRLTDVNGLLSGTATVTIDVRSGSC